MELGAFSVSLAVKDIKKSKKFYEKIGFSEFGWSVEQNWLIMKSGNHMIGLFQGMFEDNILTFNPGWNQNAENLDSFKDVRQLAKEFKEKGVQLEQETDADGSGNGPASFVMKDPDGNVILIDQHR